MPRFHFHVRTVHDFVEDLEGADFPDIASAELEAIEDARAAMSTAILRGFDISGGSTIEICDEAGSVLMQVPFRRAIIDPS